MREVMRIVGDVVALVVVLLIAYGFIVGCMMLAADEPKLQPDPSAVLIVPCTITDWYDGDTPTIEVTMRVKVRLIDCWAPEVATTNLAEKAKGIASRDYAAKRFPIGSEAKLTIPIEGMDRMDDAMTLSRVLGYLTVDGVNVSEAQVKAGHATRTKVVR